MINFSEKSNIGSISSKELADAISSRHKRIQLPSFQRDAIWDEEHVEKLWDSIIRGFPIGTLLFAHVKAQDVGQIGWRPLQDSRASAAHGISIDQDEPELIIIDGQQRSIAVSLGLRQWQPGDSARLWVDLGSSDESSVKFHACSLFKPWGKDSTTASERYAFQYLDESAKDGRHRVSLDDNTLKYTWPAAAKLPVPVGELLHWLQNGRQGDWLDLVPIMARSQQPRADIEQFFTRLLSVPDYQIPIFLVEDLSAQELGEAFQRLNKQGYTMSGEELFFSALKITWPRSHNLVWDIYRDEQAGRFLQPTKIVHLAVRLVAMDQKQSDVMRLDRDEFTRRVKGEESTAFLNGLKQMLRPHDSKHAEIGMLHSCLLRARQLLLYNPKLAIDDPGLPVVLLAKLRWRVWHTLAAWLYKNENVDNDSRLEMIRYALVDHFFSKSATDATIREPFSIAYHAEGTFPGLKIYQELFFRNLLELEIMMPADFQSRLGTETEQPPAWALLTNEYDLGLYSQRRYFQKWYPNFDPTLYKKQIDLPYDADHILPNSYKNMQGRRGSQSSIFWNWRGPVINGPGNFRYWPSSLNRADQNKNLGAKWLFGEAGDLLPEDSYLRDFQMERVSDVRAASSIREDHVSAWEKAANEGDPYNWSEPERMRALRQATDWRRMALYAELYDAMEWDSWVLELRIALKERILNFIKSSLIEPEREAGRMHLSVRAGNIHEAMRLKNQIPAICEVMETGQLLQQASVVLREQKKQEPTPDAEWELEL